MRFLLAALLFCGACFAQETTLTTPTTIGPVQVREDSESLLSASWATTGKPVAKALVYDVPRATLGAERLYITPYAHGLGIEYAGLIEVWSTKFSIHNNFRYDSIPKSPQLWVGNPLDTGGFSVWGEQEFTVVGGLPVVTNQWIEIASQTFLEQSHGDIRYIVRGENDKHEFRGGLKGSEQIYGSIGPQGLVINGVNYTTLIASLKGRLDALEQGGPVCPPPTE